jgi:hypothetical protein
MILHFIDIKKDYIKGSELQMNEIVFTGTGKIDGKELLLSFKGNDVTFDLSDKKNPKLIIELLLNKEDNTWYELECDSTFIKEGK